MVVPFAGDAVGRRAAWPSRSARSSSGRRRDRRCGQLGRGVLPRGLRRPRGAGNQGEVVLLRAERRGRGRAVTPRVANARTIVRGIPSARDDEERWLLFTDSDCVPQALISWTPTSPSCRLADDVGALAGLGALGSRRSGTSLPATPPTAAFSTRRRAFTPPQDAAATANLAVRRTAFDEIGGFTEGIRSGGDVDLCRRLVGGGLEDRAAPRRRRHAPPPRVAARPHGLDRPLRGGRAVAERALSGHGAGVAARAGAVHCGKDIAGDLVGRRFEEAAFRERRRARHVRPHDRLPPLERA